MNFNIKNFASKAAHGLSKAVQFTEERLGHAEKTEYDPAFLSLVDFADRTKSWTERLVSQTEAVLQPNPGTRLEDFVNEKLERQKKEHLTDVELLAQIMTNSGSDFGLNTQYGAALVKIGNSEGELGKVQRDYIQMTNTSFLQPLRNFLDGDMKTIAKERKTLEDRRLDLDACKSRLRKATAQAQQNSEAEASGKVVDDKKKKNVTEMIAGAENDVRVAQADFDKQLELTKLLLEGLSSQHAYHVRCLFDFIEAQTQYHQRSLQVLQDLQRQMGSAPPAM